MPTEPALLERLRKLWNESPKPAEAAPTAQAAADAVEADAWVIPWTDAEPVDCRPGGSTPWCPMYRHPKAWKSIYGDHLICATCHPPAVPSVVAGWVEIDPPDA